jgi:hypothetical protein
MTTTTPTAIHVKSPLGRPPEGDVDLADVDLADVDLADDDLGAETVLATMLLGTGYATNLVDTRTRSSREFLM